MLLSFSTDRFGRKYRRKNPIFEKNSVNVETPYRSVSILPYPSGLLLCGVLFVLGAKLGSTRRKARHKER